MKIGTQKNKNRKISNQTKKNIQNDFYSSINHSWLKHYKIPPDETSVNLFNLLQKKINNQILELIKKCEKHPKNNQENNLVILYKSCDSYNSILANQQLFYFLQTLFDFLKRKDLYKFLEWMTYSGFEYPFNISANHYIYNSQENILNVYPGEFSFNNKEIYLKNNLLYKHFRREYIVFLKVLFQFIFGPKHEYKVENILKIETEMAKYLYNSTENNDLEKKNNFYSLSEMKNHFSLDFQKICLFLGISN